MDFIALQDRLHTIQIIWKRLLPYALYSAWQHQRPTSSSESSSESMSSSSSSLSSSLSIPNPPPSVVQKAFNSYGIQTKNLHTLHMQLGGTAHNRVLEGSVICFARIDVHASSETQTSHVFQYWQGATRMGKYIHSVTDNSVKGWATYALPEAGAIFGLLQAEVLEEHQSRHSLPLLLPLQEH